MKPKGKSMKLGSGGRFAKFTAALEAKGMSKEHAAGIAAMAGRRKYGKSKMSKMAAAGRHRARME
jgi:hypothetical protein